MELKKMKSCVTDGASAMIGRHNGMAAIIKRDVPDLINIHCNTDLHLHVQMHLKSFKSFRHLTFKCLKGPPPVFF